MEHIPVPQEIYRHFKGNNYQIVTVAQHSETGEKLVIYQALYGDFKIYARPLSMFMDRVDRSKYPEAVQEYRFEPVHKAIDNADRIAKVENAGEDGRESGSRESDGRSRRGITEGETAEETAAEEEAVDIDPMVLEFLDAGSYEERLNILAGIHHRITDDMINVMAIATDIEVKPGDVETRYMELRNCLLKLEKFECNRLR